jgi:hypothetical protein
MTLQEKFDYYVKTSKPIQLPEKCISISDVHAASGGSNDPLVDSGANSVIIDVLKEYFSKGYTLLKNGDWWDVWRGYDLVKVFKAHNDLVGMADAYKHANRIYETLGNHERDLCSYQEAIIFQGFGKNIFMYHGYFGDWPNDEGWEVGKWAVRVADELGIDPYTSPWRSNPKRHEEVRKMVYELSNQHLAWDFLWGHTHHFSNEGNSHNSGCPLNPDGLRGYLIEEGNFIPIKR